MRTIQIGTTAQIGTPVAAKDSSLSEVIDTGSIKKKRISSRSCALCRNAVKSVRITKVSKSKRERRGIGKIQTMTVEGSVF